MSFAQVEPDPLDRVQLRRVGRQRHERDAGRDRECSRAVPAGPALNHDGLLVRGERFGEAIQEELHRRRADLGQDQGEGGLAVGTGGAEQVREGEAPVLPPRRTLAPQPSAMTQASLLADAHLVLEPEGDALARMGCRSLVQRPAEPPF